MSDSVVYVLVEYAPYEGGTLLGVYSDERKADEADGAVPKQSAGDWRMIHPVTLDEAPRHRYGLDDGADKEIETS